MGGVDGMDVDGLDGNQLQVVAVETKQSESKKPRYPRPCERTATDNWHICERARVAKERKAAERRQQEFQKQGGFLGRSSRAISTSTVLTVAFLNLVHLKSIATVMKLATDTVKACVQSVAYAFLLVQTMLVGYMLSG